MDKKLLKFSKSLRFEKDIMAVVNSIFELGTRYELESVDLCKCATAISELATNLVKYAENGRINVSVELEKDHSVVHVESLDDGPGIADIARALKENFSSGQSLGVGLPAVKRLTDSFIIESSPKGTLIRATKRIGRTCGK